MHMIVRIYQKHWYWNPNNKSRHHFTSGQQIKPLISTLESIVSKPDSSDFAHVNAWNPPNIFHESFLIITYKFTNMAFKHCTHVDLYICHWCYLFAAYKYLLNWESANIVPMYCNKNVKVSLKECLYYSGIIHTCMYNQEKNNSVFNIWIKIILWNMRNPGDVPSIIRPCPSFLPTVFSLVLISMSIQDAI